MTYVMVTRNKLPFLRESLPRLIAARRPDEEIIVIDGASTDGSVEFIQDLKDAGHIDQFVTEPDAGEADALNKGFRMARGPLLKNISDDDVYDWSILNACRQYLEDNSEIPVLSAMVADWNVCHSSKISVQRYIHDSAKDLTVDRFFFNCLPLMIRKSALPTLGPFQVGVLAVDLEFSLRVTGIARVAYLNMPAVVRVYNPSSISARKELEIAKELEQMCAHYSVPSPFSKKERPGEKLRRLATRFNPYSRLRRRFPLTKRNGKTHPQLYVEPSEIFSRANKWLTNKKHPPVASKIFVHSPPTQRQRHNRWTICL